MTRESADGPSLDFRYTEQSDLSTVTLNFTAGLTCPLSDLRTKIGPSLTGSN